MASVLGTDRAGLYLRAEPLTSEEARRFGQQLCRRCAGEPLQHLTGRQRFGRLDFEVRPGVFIPRPETEILVEEALRTIADIRAPVAVDIGTGAGAIALSLKDQRPDARVVGVDLSDDAVVLARDNARRLGLEIEVGRGDLMDPVSPDLRGRVDLVVSNPPYLDPAAFDGLPSDVRAEPREALVGGIEIYERIFAEAAAWVAPHGAVTVEIDETAGQRVTAAAAAAGFGREVTVVPDLAGRPRVVRALLS
jgi:release factor glutamine methyltransferase